jgi:hypothetical protein
MDSHAVELPAAQGGGNQKLKRAALFIGSNAWRLLKCFNYKSRDFLYQYPGCVKGKPGLGCFNKPHKPQQNYETQRTFY